MARLLDEFRLKDIVLRNRIAVSPMCQYSSENGFPVFEANNLTLAPDGPDWFFLDNGGSPHIARGPGNGRSAREVWKLTYNWPQVQAADHESNLVWIVPGYRRAGQLARRSLARS